MSQSNPATCPLCKQQRPLATLHKNHKKWLDLCTTCVVTLVGEALAARGKACALCGAEKEVTLFGDASQRLECPLHAQARGLLGQSLAAMDRLGAGDPAVSEVRAKLSAVLGVKEGHQ